jgi:hypothetical protein
MLVTDPKQRAGLAEIMNHPWMTKGFGGPPDNYLPQREPLQLPLDQEVVHKMHGFDFGSPEYITTALTKVLTSDDYQRAVRNAQRKHPSHIAETERKRGVFDFYKRRNSISRDTLTNPSNEAVQLGDDPINAFSPLISIYYLVREKIEREKKETNPGALAIPPTEKPLQMPDLPAPAAAYTNASAYEMAGEAPTGGRTRPRARTHGEDEVTETLPKVNIQQGDAPTTPAIVVPPEDQTPSRKESTAAGLLRRFSTRRKRDPTDHTPPLPPAVSISSPTEATTAPGPGPPRKSFSVRRTRGEREAAPSSASLNVTGSQRHQPELLTPPSAGGDSFPKRFMSLRRSTSVDRRRMLSRRGVSEGNPQPPEPPATSGSDASSYHGAKPVPENAASEDSMNRPHTATRAKSLGHARRESIQARRLRREQTKEQNVPEETDAEVAEARADHSEDTMKPVFLKGLFSVSTTSSKPLTVIRSDIIRVLKQLGVQYTEIKGGFSCKHAPSIDLNKVQDVGPQSPGLHPGSAEKSASHRRKISFTALRGNNSDQSRDDSRYTPQTPKTPSRRHPSDNNSPTNSDDSSADDEHLRQRGTARNAGETSTHVRDDVGESMILRFEIFIVKVPLLSLHGIQFKKVDGNMMHYKNMAQEILKGLKL